MYVRKCLEKLEEHQEDLKKLTEELPEPEVVEQMLISMEAPYRPSQIGIDEKTLYNSILYAKELRNRFGLLQILFDLQELEVMAKEICQNS